MVNESTLGQLVQLMAFDAGVAQRIREALGASQVTEKKMFGGMAFLSRGYMFAGIVGDTLMARIGPERYAAALTRPHVREMDFTGRPMKGYVYVDAAGIERDQDLTYWLGLCQTFVSTLPDK
jgi:hypothetical protein